MRRALALLAGAWIGASALAADEPLSARAYAVKFKSLSDAAEIVSPVLSPDGTMTLQPRLKTLTIQDRPAVIGRLRARRRGFHGRPPGREWEPS